MIKTRHKLDKCELCGVMVRCSTCNNNCCNAGYGTVNGEQCPDCPDAYRVQEAYLKDKHSVLFLNRHRR